MANSYAQAIKDIEKYLSIYDTIWLVLAFIVLIAIDYYFPSIWRYVLGVSTLFVIADILFTRVFHQEENEDDEKKVQKPVSKKLGIYHSGRIFYPKTSGAVFAEIFIGIVLTSVLTNFLQPLFKNTGLFHHQGLTDWDFFFTAMTVLLVYAYTIHERMTK